MALLKSKTIKGSSVTLPDAYCRVKALRFDHPDCVYVQVGVYEDAISPAVLDEIDYQFSVKDDFDGKDKITAATAYAVLKNLDEWADATDV